MESIEASPRAVGSRNQSLGNQYSANKSFLQATESTKWDSARKLRYRRINESLEEHFPRA
jgi:hypothetical protein